MPPEEETPSSLKCPYCGADNSIESEFCAACRKHLQVAAEVRASARLRRLLPGGKEPAGGAPSYRLWLRLAVIAALGFWYTRWLAEDRHFSFLDGVNLAAHEAGHVFLGWAGEFVGFLGGTIFQLLVPAVCLFHLKRRGANLAWQLCLFWAGESLLNVSVYAGDAAKQELPLVGGGVHDWNYLLTKLGLLAHTAGIARAIFLAGSCLIFWSLHLVWQDALERRPIELGDPRAGGFW